MGALFSWMRSPASEESGPSTTLAKGQAHWSASRHQTDCSVKLVPLPFKGAQLKENTREQKLLRAEAQAVAKRFRESLPTSYSTVKIKSIERIENPRLWRQFRPTWWSWSYRSLVCESEAFGWHGTSKAAAWRIAHEGFRQNCGCWFAFDSSYSWKFSAAGATLPKACPYAAAQLTVEVPVDEAPYHTWHGTHVMLACRIVSPAEWRTGDTTFFTNTALVYPEYILHLDP